MSALANIRLADINTRLPSVRGNTKIWVIPVQSYNQDARVHVSLHKCCRMENFRLRMQD